MLKTDKIIIVEGRYDKIRLDSIVDAVIITTDGFGIFKEKEKQAFLKKAARDKGLIILTDSDGAGFKIRNFLKNLVPEDCVTHVYIPDVFGKEKRKETASKEGKLGVEGIDNRTLEAALIRSGVFSEAVSADSREITFADIYDAGLAGGENSAERRRAFLAANGLPARLTGNNLFKVINSFFTYDSFMEAVGKLWYE